MNWILKATLHIVRFVRHIGRRFPSSHYVLLALLLFVGLELIFAFSRWIILLAGILIALLAYGIVLIRLEERHEFRLVQTILPTLAAAGLIGFSFFLPASPVLHLYFALAALLFFWLLKHGARQAYPTWNWTISTIVFFLDIAVILGIRFHLQLPLLITLGLIFLVTALISMQALRRIVPTATNTLLLAFAFAIALTQLAWALQFLPIHFLIMAGALVVVYYAAFHLISISFERPLRGRDITEYAAIGSAALLILFLTTRWV